MAEDAVETARAHLVRVVAQTSIGDPAWTIGPAAAELIVMRLEALMDAKAQLMLPIPMEFVRGSAPTPTADPTFDAQRPALPDGFTPVASVPSRGKLPPGLNHDTYVQVIYRDGKFNKPAGTGKRVEVGEASLFNWKHAGPGPVIVNVDGKGEQRQGMIGNPDDDIIGFRFVDPPENKMAMPKAVG